MTAWRENADRLRKLMKAAITKGLQEEMGRMDREQWWQIAETMPKPDAGWMEVTFTCPDADYMVTISLHDGGRRLAFTDLRGLDPEFVKAYSDHAHQGDMTPLV